MEDLSLHVLDIAENSIRAGAAKIDIRLTEDREGNRMELEIKDDGKGMEPQMCKIALDPFFSTKESKKVGLGLPLLGQAAREAGGEIILDSAPGRGTRITATFQWHHIDRKPVGDMEETVRVLKLTHPEITFNYERIKK